MPDLHASAVKAGADALRVTKPYQRPGWLEDEVRSVLAALDNPNVREGMTEAVNNAPCIRFPDWPYPHDPKDDVAHPECAVDAILRALGGDDG